MESQTKALQVDTGSCWYQQYCIDEMNRFFDLHIHNQDIKEHLKPFSILLAWTADHRGSKIIDLGCGTAMLSEFCKDYEYVGADLPHILAGCAMRNYPQYYYRSCDLCKDSTMGWIKEYPVVIVNGVIDVMEFPMKILEKILPHVQEYIIIHRQEITESGDTTAIQKGSYGGYTYHSIIRRSDFNDLIDRNNFEIIKEEKLQFGNWENGGSSFLLRKRKSYALYDIDHKLYKYFVGKENGFFIEAGANDGITQSNTMFFEFYKNWQGILVEPIGFLYNKCRENRSPKTAIYNTALVSRDYKGGDIEMLYTPECKGLLSVVNNERAPFFMERTKEKGVPTKVLACTLDQILDGYFHGVQIITIDLLVLDVEGYEENVLNGLDLKKWDIRYILVEELEKSEAISEYLVKNSNYKMIEQFSEHDYLYQKQY